MKRAASASFVVASVLYACALGAFAQEHQHDHGSPTGPLGTVHFSTSCNRAVAQDFDHAIALLHSFWYSAAIEAFTGVLKNDPSCAMADWGIAMSWWGNPFGGFRTPEALATDPVLSVELLSKTKISAAGSAARKSSTTLATVASSL